MSDIKNNDPQLASEPIASGSGMPNGITISFESLWDMLNSINLTPNIKIKLGERLIASARASARALRWDMDGRSNSVHIGFGITILPGYN